MPKQLPGREQSVSDGDLVLITLRMAQHAAASGYGRLEDYLPGLRIELPKQLTLAQRIVARLLRFLPARSGSRWYQRRNLLGELRAARLWCVRRNTLFHFLYGENSYRYLGMLKSVARGNALVVTYHTPPARFDEVVKDRKHLEQADAIIVMSNVQRGPLAEIVGDDRVFFVPHGVDVQYFRPAESRRPSSGPLDCLFVGTHLRDLDTLEAVARSLGDRRDMTFKVVTRPQNARRFSGMAHVECMSGIDDEHLLSLYQDADLLILPLLDCTANNTILEAMACGLPILSTDLVGVRDYVSDKCAILTPERDPEALRQALVDLADHRDRLAEMGKASRAQAMLFRWENVARKTEEVYEWVRRV